MLDLRELELHGVRIAVRREAVDDRASGIAEAEKLGDFVESFSRGIIAGVADIVIDPEVLRCVDLCLVDRRS